MARPPGFDKQTVLQAAERQFRKTGYAGTSLDDICTATGLGRGSLYAAFGDKHALFLEALGDYCARNESGFEELLRGPDESALSRLRCYLTGLVELARADEERLGCMAGRFAIELGEQDPQVAARIQQDFALQRAALLECVEGAQRAGDLDPAASSGDIAGLLLAITRGMEVIARAGADLATLQATANQAYASLPLTPRARRRRTAALKVVSESDS
jgi:TetR/AcrR family transcriptional regulator, transcriptional repressor for nem operon